MLRKLFGQKNQKGFSLVEMLAAFTLLGVAAAAIGGFLVVGIRSYTKTHSEAALQKEAQTALNQIEATIIDAALGVNYNVRSTGDVDHFVISDGDEELNGLTVQDKVLYIFDWAQGENGVSDYTTVRLTLIRWDPETQCLYYAIPRFTLDHDKTISEAVQVNSVSEWDLFAEGITAFSCDLSSYASAGKIHVNLSLKLRNQTYDTNGTILLRNNVLINAENMEEIYERADQVLESTITDVEISSSSNSIVRTGRVQLTTHVNGTGYPSQTISKWTVETVTSVESVTTGEDGVILITNPTIGAEIYNSVSDGDHDWAADINSTTKVLTLDGGNDHDTLLKDVKYIRVTAYAVDPQNVGNLVSGTRYIAVKSISTFSIQPDRTKFEQAYGTGNGLGNDYKAVSWKNGAQDTTGTMKVNAGYEFTLNGTVTGVNLDSTGENPDTAINWTIEEAGEGVRATVSSQGVVTVNTFSTIGSFKVKATPVLNDTMSLYYQVEVVHAYDLDNDLSLTGADTMNRGQSSPYRVQLNGNDLADLSEFILTTEVTDQNGVAVASGPVYVSRDGMVTVTDRLPYDYEYTVTLKAALRSNPSKFTTFKIKVPKVTLTMNYPIFLINTKGTTVKEGKIRCFVTGVEDYTLIWSIASNTNSQNFAGSTLNGSYVSYSGKSKADSAEIFYSRREPDKACIWVKASLKDHTNVYATSRIMVRYEGGKLTLTSDKTRVTRGDSAHYTVTNEYKVYNASEYTWSFDAKYVDDGSAAPLTGLTLENGTLYVDNDYNAVTRDIQVDVKVVWAYIADESQDEVVTEGEQAVASVIIPGYKVEITSANGKLTVNRGSTLTLQSDYEANWTINATEFSKGIRFKDGSTTVSSNSFTGTTAVIMVPFEYRASEAKSKKYCTVTASVPGFTTIEGGLSSSVKLTINAVSLTDISVTNSSGSYVFKIKYKNTSPTYKDIVWKVTKADGTEITSGKSTKNSGGYSILTFTPPADTDGELTIQASSSRYTGLAAKTKTILNLVNPSTLSNWDTVSYRDWGKTKTTTDLSTGLFDTTHYYRFSRKTTTSVIYLKLQYTRYSSNEDTYSNGYWAYLKDSDTWYQWRDNVWVQDTSGPKSVTMSTYSISAGSSTVKNDLLYGTIRW